ncbi:MAG: ShlB/FhaC/HecB family hemolysin secretion/activation protein [Candidatus Thiodiazotropha sp. (ex Monitilora ramsayi)]|nr:ShlB/FhaC/HecB family hemolysin secretion/activation protein [Candidatus Thiodiazotropha sp. (ex Monitilora ramsayi)]
MIKLTLRGCRQRSASLFSRFEGINSHRHHTPIGYLLFIFTLVTIPLPGFADDANRLLREQRDQDRRTLEQLRELPDTQIDYPRVEEPTESASGPCFDISELAITGATQLTDDERLAAEEMVVGACVGLNEINRLIRFITNLYIEKGLVTTRAYIPSQDLSTGRLEILVLEGRVEGVEESSGRGELNIDTAFPGATGELFDLRDFEQGLDQINRLPSNNARLQIEPGSKPGMTRVMIHNEASRRWRARAALDNYNGDEKLDLHYSVDNPLALNDQLSVTASHSYADTASDSLSLFWSVPYGYWLYTTMASYFDYRGTIEGLTQNLATEGDSVTLRTEAQRVLFRTRKGRLDLVAGLQYRDTENLIEEVLLEVSSPTLSTWDLAMNWTLPLGNGVFQWHLGLVNGIGAFGATKGGETEESAHGRFRSYETRLTYSHPFRAGDTRAVFVSDLTAQSSDVPLYGSQQLSLTGFWAVRALQGSSVAADRGLYWRNELSVSLPTQRSDVQARFFFALDYGRTDERFGEPDRKLTGVAVGINGAWRQLGYNLVVADLYEQRALTDIDEDPVIYAQLSWSI